MHGQHPYLQSFFIWDHFAILKQIEVTEEVQSTKFLPVMYNPVPWKGTNSVQSKIIGKLHNQACIMGEE